MSGEVRIDVVRAHDVADVTRRALARTLPDVERYGADLRRYLAAPSDLPVSHRDLRPAIEHDTDDVARLLTALDRLADLVAELDDRAAGQVRSADDALVHAEIVDLLDEDWLERLRERAEDVFGWLGRVTPFDEIVQRFPEVLTVTIARVETVVRRTTIIIDRVADDVVRRTLVTIDEVEQTLRQASRSFDITWLRRSAPWLKRMGQVGDVLAGGFAGMEQWEEDAARDDLTSTERVLRAGTDGVVRGGVQMGIGAVTGGAAAAAVAAAPFTLGGSLVVGGLVIAAGVVAGEVLDPLVDQGLDWVYEQEAFGWTADRIDDLGRGLRDGWDAAYDWGADRLDDLRELPGVADRAWDSGWETAGDLAEDAGDWVGDRLDDLGGLGGSLVGALPWG